MRGRTLYVVPYCMGPIDSPLSRCGVEITDSPYVVANMRIMTRMGAPALARIEREGSFVKGLHSIGELDPEQIFYMMTRGISRAEAVRVLVEGYFEEVIQRLDDPGLEDLVRRRISEKLAGAEDQVREFIGERAEAS